MTDIKTIAKNVRADIASAIKSGKLPAGLKTSVRIDRYSMGCSLDVKVTALPAGFPVLNEKRERFAAENPHVFPSTPELRERHSPEARALLERLSAMVAAYNRRHENFGGDYGDYRYDYHQSVAIDSSIELSHRASTAATKPAPSTTDLLGLAC